MTTQTNETQKEQSDKEHNFEQLRKKLESAEREKNQALAKAAAYEKEIAEATKKKFRDPEPDDDVYDEPYVDEKRLNRKLEKFEERFTRKVDEVADQKAREIVRKQKDEDFLKKNSDFSQILSQENIEKFVSKHPEIAEPMLEMPEGFARQKLLYENIKALGVHKPAAREESIQEKIDKNARSPFYRPSGVNAAPYAGGGDFSAVGQKSAYDKVQELKARLRL